MLLQLLWAGKALHAGGAEEALGAAHRRRRLISGGDRDRAAHLHLPTAGAEHQTGCLPHNATRATPPAVSGRRELQIGH